MLTLCKYVHWSQRRISNGIHCSWHCSETLQGLSLNGTLTITSRLDDQQVPRICLSLIPVLGVEDSNSSPHACTASTLTHWGMSPTPWNLILPSCFPTWFSQLMIMSSTWKLCSPLTFPGTCFCLTFYAFVWWHEAPSPISSYLSVNRSTLKYFYILTDKCSVHWS